MSFSLYVCLSWERFNKEKKMKYASDFKDNDEMRGRVSFNTVEAASAMLKYLKEMSR